MTTAQEREFLDLKRFSSPNKCPICLTSSFKRIGDVPTIHPKSTLQVSVLRCDACAHWFSSPRPDQEYLSELYSSGSLSVLGDGWASSTAVRSGNASGNKLEATHFSHWILQDEINSKAGNYLEIGPGDCRLLQAFNGQGWNGWGVEPGDWGQGVRQIVRNIRELPAQFSFDVVVIHDVLEHLSEPDDLLKEVNQKIASNGRLYLAFPNVDSVEAIVLKTKWSMVRPIGHLHYFSKKSLSHLLKNNGYSIAYAKKSNVGASWNVVGAAAKKIVFEGKVKGFLIIAKFLVKRVLDTIRVGDQWRVRAVKHDICS